jgi:co-chaperonin GroES (HSP10)
MLKIKPLENCVVIRQSKDKQSFNNFMTQVMDTNEKALVGVVAFVNPKNKILKVGDKVVFQGNANNKVKIDDLEYLFVEVDKIYAILEAALENQTIK